MYHQKSVNHFIIYCKEVYSYLTYLSRVSIKSEFNWTFNNSDNIYIFVINFVCYWENMTIINKEVRGRIIGYARVSTRDQNLDMQLDVLQRQDCAQIFCEKISGVKKRPELEHCLSTLQAGDVLVVYKLDRLARSLSEIVRICSELENKKIRIKSVKDNIDTTDYMGKFTMHIFAALAEFERNVIMERTREGREAARKRGKKFGRPQGLNPETRQKVKKAALLYQKGFAVKQICQQIEIKSKSTLYKYLQLENIPLRSFSKN